jgi:hypothetical protein
MAEYRGYGGNPGTPTERGLVADGAAALDFLDGEGIAANRLVIYGESLGSGVAVLLAAQREVAGLILEAPFTSVADVAQHHYSFMPASALVRDRFDSLARIGQVRAPILVLHGERDRVVPLRFGRALFDAAPEPKELWLAREAGHEDLARYGALERSATFCGGASANQNNRRELTGCLDCFRSLHAGYDLPRFSAPCAGLDRCEPRGARRRAAIGMGACGRIARPDPCRAQ